MLAGIPPVELTPAMTGLGAWWGVTLTLPGLRPPFHGMENRALINSHVDIFKNP